MGATAGDGGGDEGAIGVGRGAPQFPQNLKVRWLGVPHRGQLMVSGWGDTEGGDDADEKERTEGVGGWEWEGTAPAAAACKGEGAEKGGEEGGGGVGVGVG
ncbi:MAG: hypothetical protein NZM37_06105 [Sandaracinaceae bacterium]|nr:hypothetical protein [Sandaracinaceae bacterium]MDW8245309.1 hypothetical protein [Sandaracinaceae bacterium]